MKKLFPLLLMMSLLAAFTSCSDDDEYNSSVPTFSDIVFSDSLIYVDQQVTATAIQSKKGKLLDRTDYRWYSNMYTPNDSTMSYTNAVLYDNNSTNPTCTFHTPSYPGRYSITFHGIYNISGRASNNERVVNNNNTTIVYQYTPLKGYVTITKSFYVRRRIATE